jgi:hypothetical protein
VRVDTKALSRRVVLYNNRVELGHPLSRARAHSHAKCRDGAIGTSRSGSKCAENAQESAQAADKRNRLSHDDLPRMLRRLIAL